jgi:hypothetical protein
MNREQLPGGENSLEQINTPKAGDDILDLEKDFIDTDLDGIPEGTEDLYQNANEEKGFEIVQASEELTRLDEKEELKEKKEKFIADIIGEQDPEKKEQLKKEYEEMLINEASLETEKSESFEILSTGLADLSQAELKAKGGHFAEKVIGKIGQITDKGLYFYLPKKWKDSKGGKYLKYASSAAMVTALVAVLAPSSGAIASVGVAGYFGLKLVKTIIGAKIGGAVGVGAAKLYENLKGDKEEKMEQTKLEQAIENGDSIESVVNLIKEIEDNKIKRENNKLKLALIGGLAGGLGTMSVLDLLEGAAITSGLEADTQDDTLVKGAKTAAKQGAGIASGSNKVIHELQRIFNLSH